MAQNQNLAAPGQAFLYLPHLLFLGTPQAPGAPNPAGLPAAACRLPFVLPRLNMSPHTLPQATRCRPLHRFEGFSTGDNAVTDPNVAGARLEGDGETLVHLRRCADLNARLYAYADPNPNSLLGVPPNHPDQMPLWNLVHPNQVYVPGMKGLTTAGTSPAHTHPFASAGDQYDAIRRLSGWFVEHVGDLDEAVESEPSIQDHVKKQLLDPLSYLMRTRYANYNNVGTNLLLPLPHQPAVNVHFPRFGRPSHATHTTAPITGHASGVPDCLLFENRVNGAQNLCGEVKTFWAYTVQDAYQGVFNHHTAITGTGAFRWHRPAHIAAKLVKQVWCELVHYGCKWGYSTNGRAVMIFVRLGRNRLVAGDPIPWDSPMLLQTLAGLCFASIDEALRPGLRAYLCHGHAVTW